jgi:hypothetical protein
MGMRRRRNCLLRVSSVGEELIVAVEWRGVKRGGVPKNRILVSRREGTPPCFLYVWQTKDFKSNEFGSVANTGVAVEILGCVARKGVRGGL